MGPPHRDPLPLSAGQRPRLALEIRLDVQHGGRALHPGDDLGLRQAAQLQRERHVLVDCHVRVEGVVLEHHRDVAAGGRHVVDAHVADEDVARRDLLQSGDDAQQGRFPASGRPDEDHELGIGGPRGRVRG